MPRNARFLTRLRVFVDRVVGALTNFETIVFLEVAEKFVKFHIIPKFFGELRACPQALFPLHRGWLPLVIGKLQLNSL